jgi:hypothetical protein
MEMDPAAWLKRNFLSPTPGGNSRRCACCSDDIQRTRPNVRRIRRLELDVDLDVSYAVDGTSNDWEHACYGYLIRLERTFFEGLRVSFKGRQDFDSVEFR